MTASRHLERSLSSHYDGIVCDLDGVVYRGQQAMPYAVSALEHAQAAGTRLVYATNNASRPPEEVATQLRGLGLGVPSSSVVTSAQAGARHLAQDLAPGSPVLAIGGPGVTGALLEAGLRPVITSQAQAGEAVMAVLQGYGADVSWHDLAEAAYAIAAGARWVATNDDSTLPTARGTAPGNGALVAAVQRAVTQRPTVVGKPHTSLYVLSARVLGCSTQRTLAIGDRLDTDIAGAVTAGMDSLFVLGGVHGLRDAAEAAPHSRPTYLGADLRCLGQPYTSAERIAGDGSGPAGDGAGPAGDGAGGRGREHRQGERQPQTPRQTPTPTQTQTWRCGRAVARLDPGGTLWVAQDGSADELLRVVVAASWYGRDAGMALRGSGDDWDALACRIAAARSGPGSEPGPGPETSADTASAAAQ